MTWTEILHHPSLQNLPYKIEMSEWGNVEMSPLGANHARHQSQIAQLLQRYKPGGIVRTQAAVQTTDNIKVSDVIWASEERAQSDLCEAVWNRAPQICVEIVTPEDPPEEGRHKAKLYLQAGAEEFWISNERGEMQFCAAGGWLERSRLCPEFPVEVSIPS